MPMILIPFGSGGFGAWAWASAGTLARPTTSKLAAATMETFMVIDALSRKV